MTDAETGSEGATTKTARNEGRKLVATAANNLGVALLPAAFVQPVILYLQQRQRADAATMIAVSLSGLTAVALFLGAHYVIRRLEDRSWIHCF